MAEMQISTMNFANEQLLILLMQLYISVSLVVVSVWHKSHQTGFCYWWNG